MARPSRACGVLGQHLSRSGNTPLSLPGAAPGTRLARPQLPAPLVDLRPPLALCRPPAFRPRPAPPPSTSRQGQRQRGSAVHHPAPGGLAQGPLLLSCPLIQAGKPLPVSKEGHVSFSTHPPPETLATAPWPLRQGGDQESQRQPWDSHQPPAPCPVDSSPASCPCSAPASLAAFCASASPARPSPRAVPPAFQKGRLPGGRPVAGPHQSPTASPSPQHSKPSPWFPG